MLDRFSPRHDLSGPTLAVGGAAAVVGIVALILWVAGVFDHTPAVDSHATAAAAHSAGIVDCGMSPSATTGDEYELAAAALGGDAGQAILPYRTNLADYRLSHDGAHLTASIFICMPVDATRNEIADTATVIAQHIKTLYRKQQALSSLTVNYLGTGSVPLATLHTVWADHPFAADTAAATQRAAWTWDDNPSN